MTEKRLAQIALEMDEPLNRLEQLDTLLIEMVVQCRPDQDSKSQMYSLFQRNLGPDLGELQKLWQEFCSLTGIDAGVTPLKAVEE